MYRNIFVFLSVLWLLLTPQANAQIATFPTSGLAVVTQNGGRHAFRVEVATTSDQLAQGLMFRRTLAADAGMLFDFGQSRPVAMWMKNTLIPLDMLFMDRTGTVVHVEALAVPESLEPRGPSQPVLAVLELPGGTARRLGIKVGDRIEHPIFARGG